MVFRKGPWNLYSAFTTFLLVFVIYRFLRVGRTVISTKNEPTEEVNCPSNNVYAYIPGYMHEFVMDIIDNDQFTMPTCTGVKKDNFVYLKVQRCATETLSAVFRRFALTHNRTVVLPIGGKSFLGWPHFIDKIMYRKSNDDRYNIILDQAVYNRTIMEKLVAHDAVYFTNLREPFSRLKSALTVGAMKACGLMPEDVDDVTTEFLRNMEQYDKTYKSPSNVFINSIACRCIKKGVSIAKNAMAFDLGFPTGFHIGSRDKTYDYSFIKTWLQNIHSQMNFILIQERFDESMVFLKRYMCWSFKDILYKPLDYSGEKPNIVYDQPKVNKYRQWNNIDTILYEMASITFDKRVKTLGEDFRNEVDEFRQQLQRVTSHCSVKGTMSDEILNVESTQWDAGYTVTHSDCIFIYDWHQVKDTLKRYFDNHNVLGRQTMEEGWNYNAWC